MTFQSSFLALMPDTVAIAPFLRYSTAGSGAYTYSTGQTALYRLRLTATKKMEFQPMIQGVVPSHVAWLATTADIDPRSRFLYQGTTYRILEVQRQRDGQGAHHAKLILLGG